MKRELIHVEPLSEFLDRLKAPVSPVVRCGDTVYVSGLPPFDPSTGTVFEGPVARQAEIVLDQMQLCLETAGTSLSNVLKCNVYCTDPGAFGTFNTIYARYFTERPPARIFVCVPCWPGKFDLEIDCIATM